MDKIPEHYTPPTMPDEARRAILSQIATRHLKKAPVVETAVTPAVSNAQVLNTTSKKTVMIDGVLYEKQGVNYVPAGNAVPVQETSQEPSTLSLLEQTLQKREKVIGSKEKIEDNTRSKILEKVTNLDIDKRVANVLGAVR